MKKIFFTLTLLFLFIPNVFAIPTGEIYSETNSSNITMLAKFQYIAGEVSLYGRSGSGQSNPFIPSLNEFRDGNYSLFTYQSIPSGTRSSFGMHFYLNETLMSGKSYTSTFKVAGSISTIQYYFSEPYSINNANFNSSSITCLSDSCFISTTFTMSSSTNELHIDFSPPEGLNGQIFVDIFTGIFMVQVEEYSYMDTSGIQNNQQIIIDQNDTIIQEFDNLNENITSTDGPTNLSELDNSAGWLPAGAVDSILNLPLSLFNSLTTVLSATCQPVNLTFPFINYSFQLPCVDDIYSKIGHLNSLLNTIGFIVSALILYKYFINLYGWVDDTLTFRENHHHDWGGV